MIYRKGVPLPPLIVALISLVAGAVLFIFTLPNNLNVRKPSGELEAASEGWGTVPTNENPEHKVKDSFTVSVAGKSLIAAAYRDGLLCASIKIVEIDAKKARLIVYDDDENKIVSPPTYIEVAMGQSTFINAPQHSRRYNQTKITLESLDPETGIAKFLFEYESP